MIESVMSIYSLGVSHNKFPLPLPDHTFYPEHRHVLDARPIEFLKQFNRVRDRDWSEVSFLDLGCSEGSTTLGLSQMGSTVYGVEGRSDGIKRAKVLQEIVKFNNTHFYVGNVNEEQSFREVDGIFNAGILYHLEDPITFLERCAKNARQFMYIDTGHAPDDDEELRNSKFSAFFGERLKLDYNGLKIDAINFAEPSDVSEKQNGRRRGPRSGIGNTNSVWLSHRGLIDLMKELGFPYHVTIRQKRKIPRYRTAFFRKEPALEAKLGPLLQPLPIPASPREAVANARKRDILYLQSSDRPVTVVGRNPLLSATVEDLKSNGISIQEVIEVAGRPDDKITARLMQQSLDGRDGLLVSTFKDQETALHRLMLLDQFEYIFSSFSMNAECEM